MRHCVSWPGSAVTYRMSFEQLSCIWRRWHLLMAATRNQFGSGILRLPTWLLFLSNCSLLRSLATWKNSNLDVGPILTSALSQMTLNICGPQQSQAGHISFCVLPKVSARNALLSQAQGAKSMSNGRSRPAQASECQIDPAVWDDPPRQELNREPDPTSSPLFGIFDRSRNKRWSTKPRQ